MNWIATKTTFLYLTNLRDYYSGLMRLGIDICTPVILLFSVVFDLIIGLWNGLLNIARKAHTRMK